MNINQFQRLIPKIKTAIELEVQNALAVVAEKIAETAKAKIGTEQEGWKELADSTIENKRRKNLAVPAPLLETGEMRDSIAAHAEGLRAVVGTDNPKGVYHELGTGHVSARPFLFPSAIENADFLEAELQAAIERALNGL